MIPFDPATIVEIKVGDVSAPVAIGVEMTKLYLSADKIVKRLIEDVRVDPETKNLVIPFELLPWYKEQRMLLVEIGRITGNVEEKVNIRKMELQAEIFKQFIKELPEKEKVILIKTLKRKVDGRTSQNV